MAQLFPGAVAVLSAGFLFQILSSPQPDSFLISIQSTIADWGALTLTAQLFLAGLCVGAGMAIHGIHWSVIGYYESTEGNDVFHSFWYNMPLIFQVLLGPPKIVGETAIMVWGAKTIQGAAVPENVPQIHKDLFPHFEFLQEFYLYSAQFFAHTAYALVISLASAIAFVAVNGLTPRRLAIAIVVYLACGVFFVLGRVQLSSLFSAEIELARRSAWQGIGA